MAILRGKGSMTGINLVGRVYDNSWTQDGKSVFIDFQVDARDERGAGQTNLHLKSEEVKQDGGQSRFNNGAAYSKAQYDEIVKASAGADTPILSKDGTEELGKAFGIKGNVMPANRGTGLVVNTKTLEASDFAIDDKTITNQFESMKEARATRKAETEAAAEVAPEAAAEAAAEVQVEEPAVG